VRNPKIETAIQKRLLYFSTGCLTARVTGGWAG